MPKLKQAEFYCVKCKKSVECDPAKIRTVMYKNKKTGSCPALKCMCPNCGTKLNKFIKKDDYDRLSQKYGKY